MKTELSLEVKHTIPAVRKDVFEAWLNPTLLGKFMIPGKGMESTAKCNATVGGEFEIIMKAGEQEIPHHGEYKVIDRFNTLAFTWVSAYTQPDSLVTLTFKDVAPDATEVILRHENFPSEDSRNSHEGGWAEILEALESVLKS